MKKKKNIRVFSAFAGIDTQFMALKRLEKSLNKLYGKRFEIEFRLIGWCEIDSDAIASHNALFPEVKEEAIFNSDKQQMEGYHYSDITKIDWCKVPDFDLLVYSSCCQSITRAGTQNGMTEGSGTPSSLIWHIREAVWKKRPKYCVLENVFSILENKFVGEFEKWADAIEEFGYTNTWSILRAPDYGIPQNRSRAFLVSIRNDLNQRYYFPEPIGCTKSAEDFLDEAVDERYYFPEEDMLYFLLSLNNKNLANCNMCKQINSNGTCIKRIFTPTCKHYNCHVSPTLVADANYATESFKKYLASSHFPRPGVFEVWKCSDTTLRPYKDLINGAPVNNDGKFKIINNSREDILNEIMNIEPGVFFRLRRLTPRECFRLMGIDDFCVKKLLATDVSEGQRYKQAGNAIVVDVLYYLFQNLFKEVDFFKC